MALAGGKMALGKMALACLLLDRSRERHVSLVQTLRPHADVELDLERRITGQAPQLLSVTARGPTVLPFLLSHAAAQRCLCCCSSLWPAAAARCCT